MRCGSCKKYINSTYSFYNSYRTLSPIDDRELGPLDQIISDKQQDRSGAFNARITRSGAQPGPATNPLGKILNPPTVDLTMDGTDGAKHFTGSTRAAHITVCIDVRIKGKISSTFGSTVPFPETHRWLGSIKYNPIITHANKIIAKNTMLQV